MGEGKKLKKQSVRKEQSRGRSAGLGLGMPCWERISVSRLITVDVVSSKLL